MNYNVWTIERDEEGIEYLKKQGSDEVEGVCGSIKVTKIIKPTFKFYKLPHAKHLPLPYKATEGSAGYDVHASMIGAGEEGFALKSGWIIKVSTGLCADIPKGWEIQIRPRSGLASKYGVTVLNAPATIDSDYTGEISVLLINHGYDDFIIRDGDRIAQFVFAPVYDVNVESVDVIEKRTHRGDNGFGSTGNTSVSRKKMTEEENVRLHNEMIKKIVKEVTDAFTLGDNGFGSTGGNGDA